MIQDNDPTISAQILSWIINAIFAVALLVGRMTFNRSMQKADIIEQRTLEKHNEIEARLRTLEKESVTHADLRRIEDKIDEHYKQITERLNRILERNSK